MNNLVPSPERILFKYYHANLSDGALASEIRSDLKHRSDRLYNHRHGNCNPHPAILQFFDLSDEDHGEHTWLIAASTVSAARLVMRQARGYDFMDEWRFRKVATDRYLCTFAWTNSWAEYI